MKSYMNWGLLGIFLLGGGKEIATEEEYTISITAEKISARERQALQQDILEALEGYIRAIVDELALFGQCVESGYLHDVAVISFRIDALQRAVLFFQQGVMPSDIDVIPAVTPQSPILFGVAIRCYARVQKELLRAVRGILEHDIDCPFVRVKKRARMKEYVQIINAYTADSVAAAQKMCKVCETGGSRIKKSDAE